MDEPAPFGAYRPSRLAQRLIHMTQRLPNTWAGRRLHVLLRHLAIPLLKRSPLDVERLGARMRLFPYNNICDKKVLFAPQFFDPDEMELLKARMTDRFTFVDVGANIGAYSLFVAAHAGPAARILAVEPQPDVFDRLIYNIRQNPFGTVKAVACAVADKPGDLTMFLAERNRGESSVKIVGPGEEMIRVPATTLLNLVTQQGFSHLDAIKLDVEGSEDIILEPFFRDAPASLYPSLIIIEKGGHWQIDLPGLLKGRGYRLVHETRLNLVFERDEDGGANG